MVLGGVKAAKTRLGRISNSLLDAHDNYCRPVSGFHAISTKCPG